MRDVPAVMTQRWRGGDYMGDSRAIARVTIQQGLLNLYGSGITLYSSIIFDNPNVPVEFTGVNSVKWDRGIDQDAATANIVLWNTADLAVGEQPFSDEELDLPGIFTYQLDGEKYGRLPNDMAQLVVPDNILRTYEGYGFDAELPPEKDPNLVQTGTWMIDRVKYNVQDGTITVECRDLVRILIDQVAYKPVIPDEHYPLRFSARNTNQGFHAPFARNGINNVTGYSSEAYHGSTLPPVITTAKDAQGQVDGASGNGQVTIAFDPPNFAPAQSPLPEGYTADLGTVFRAPKGYLVRYDPYDNGDDVFHSTEWYLCSGPGQVNAAIYLYGPATSVTDGAIPPEDGTLVELFGGPGELERYIPRNAPIGYNVYVSSRLQPIALDEDEHEFTLTGLQNGNIYLISVAAVWQDFESSAKQTGVLSTPVVARPTGGAAVSVDALTQNVTPINGGSTWRVSWTHDAGSTPVQWTVVQYQGFGEDGDFVRTYTGTTSTPDDAHLDIPAIPDHDDNEYSYLVYGRIGGVTGRGNLLPAVQGEAQFYQPPMEGSPPPFDYTVDGGLHPNDPDQVIPRDVVPIDIVGTGSSALKSLSDEAALREIENIRRVHDDDMATWWNSEVKGNSGERVWLEVAVPNVTVARVRVFTHEVPYQMWVHVYADGEWRSYDSSNVIGGIPYLQAIGSIVEGPTDFIPQVPIANVTKVRLTVSNLKPTQGGYRAKVRHVEVGVPLVEINESQDPNRNTFEAKVVGGAGERPHTYNDYTDIVKLLCAWGGFFWPQDGYVRASDGTDTQFNFGQAPYNLGDNIDVVLGADTGRVWGDFETSGTAGRAKLPVSQFDKKPLMDGINSIRNILGFCFYADEEGGIVWRQINVFRVGNYLLTRSETPGFTLERVVLDERLHLMDIETTVDSANVRDKLYVATTTGRHGAVVDGFVENDIGLRRVAGWTDQHFTSDQECEVMATMIAIRQLFTYRTSRVTIPGYPAIQINDQVQIRERITQEDFLHFVSEVTSQNDLTTGEWTYDLTTHWLGTDPEEGEWAIDLSALLPSVQEVVDVQAEAAGLPPREHYDRRTP